MPQSKQNGVSFTSKLTYPAFRDEKKNFAYFNLSPDFKPQEPFILVLFFHGFNKQLDEQVKLHALAEQVASSGINCVLACPRTAIVPEKEVNPGAFRSEQYFNGFLEEIPRIVENDLNDRGVDTTGFVLRAANAPIVLATFSAGHAVVSAILPYAVVQRRLLVCSFFDSLYRGDYYFKEPATVLKYCAMVGVYRSNYDDGDYERDNHRDLVTTLTGMGKAPAPSLAGVASLGVGQVVMESVNVKSHWEIVSNASRLSVILSKAKLQAKAYSARFV